MLDEEEEKRIANNSAFVALMESLFPALKEGLGKDSDPITATHITNVTSHNAMIENGPGVESYIRLQRQIEASRVQVASADHNAIEVPAGIPAKGSGQSRA